jgi:hypothetical protein
MKNLYYAYVGISSLILNISYNKHYYSGRPPISPTPVTPWSCVSQSADVTIWVDNVYLKLLPPFAPVCPRFAKTGLTPRQDDRNTSPSYSTPPAAHKVLGDSVRVTFLLGKFPKHYFAFLLAQLVPFSSSPLPRFAEPGRQHTTMVFNMVCPPPPSKPVRLPAACPLAYSLQLHFAVCPPSCLKKEKRQDLFHQNSS